MIDREVVEEGGLADAVAGVYLGGVAVELLDEGFDLVHEVVGSYEPNSFAVL